MWEKLDNTYHCNHLFSCGQSDFSLGCTMSSYLIVFWWDGYSCFVAAYPLLPLLLKHSPENMATGYLTEWQGKELLDISRWDGVAWWSAFPHWHHKCFCMLHFMWVIPWCCDMVKMIAAKRFSSPTAQSVRTPSAHLSSNLEIMKRNTHRNSAIFFFTYGSNIIYTKFYAVLMLMPLRTYAGKGFMAGSICWFYESETRTKTGVNILNVRLAKCSSEKHYSSQRLKMSHYNQHGRASSFIPSRFLFGVSNIL